MRMGNSLERRWSEETDSVLRAAGWHPGRAIPIGTWEHALRESGDFQIHDAAGKFLTEFGGLEVPARGAGITMARMAFHLDPLAAQWDDEIFDVLSEEAGAYLYPIGEADRRNSYLGMTSTGAVYWGMDSGQWLAHTPEKALENLVEGIQEP
jgi:hypothetical protein